MSHEYVYSQIEPLDEKYIESIDVQELYTNMNLQRITHGLTAVSWPVFWDAYLIKEPWIQL